MRKSGFSFRSFIFILTIFIFITSFISCDLFEDNTKSDTPAVDLSALVGVWKFMSSSTCSKTMEITYCQYEAFYTGQSSLYNTCGSKVTTGCYDTIKTFIQFNGASVNDAVKIYRSTDNCCTTEEDPAICVYADLSISEVSAAALKLSNNFAISYTIANGILTATVTPTTKVTVEPVEVVLTFEKVDASVVDGSTGACPL